MIAGETEELGENLPSATLPHHKSHMPRSGFEPRTAEVGSQRLTALSYGAAEKQYALVKTLSHKRYQVSVQEITEQ
jgi:hypothetical protein